MSVTHDNLYGPLGKGVTKPKTDGQKNEETDSGVVNKPIVGDSDEAPGFEKIVSKRAKRRRRPKKSESASTTNRRSPPNPSKSKARKPAKQKTRPERAPQEERRQVQGSNIANMTPEQRAMCALLDDEGGYQAADVIRAMRILDECGRSSLDPDAIVETLEKLRHQDEEPKQKQHEADVKAEVPVEDESDDVDDVPVLDLIPPEDLQDTTEEIPEVDEVAESHIPRLVYPDPGTIAPPTTFDQLKVQDLQLDVASSVTMTTDVYPDYGEWEDEAPQPVQAPSQPVPQPVVPQPLAQQPVSQSVPVSSAQQTYPQSMAVQQQQRANRSLLSDSQHPQLVQAPSTQSAIPENQESKLQSPPKPNKKVETSNEELTKEQSSQPSKQPKQNKSRKARKRQQNRAQKPLVENAETDQLLQDVTNWNPCSDVSMRSLGLWCDQLQRSGKGFNNFFDRFYQVHAVEIIVRTILNSRTKPPNQFLAVQLKKLFGHCIYGTADYHDRVLENVRETRSQMENCRSRQELIDQTIAIISILKIPPENTDATALQRHFRNPELDKTAQKYDEWKRCWQASQHSFDSYRSSYTKLSSLQKDLSHYAPTETLREGFKDVNDSLDRLLQQYNNHVQHQQSRLELSKQRDKTWNVKHHNQIRPLENDLVNVTGRMEKLVEDKHNLELQLRKIQIELAQLQEKKSTLDGSLRTQSHDLQQEYNTIKSEENEVTHALDSRKRDYGCAQNIRSFLKLCEQQLFEDGRQKIEQFAGPREKCWQEYLDSTHIHFNELVRLIRQRETRIVTLTKIHAELATHVGTTSNDDLKTKMDQDRAAIQSINREVEDIVNHVLQLVSPASVIFQSFLSKLSDVSNILKLQKLLQYKKEPSSSYHDSEPTSRGSNQNSKSVDYPVVQPPSVQPPSVQPPSVQPPSVQPPSVQPPPVQPPSVQPPLVQPPSVQPPAVQPSAVQLPASGAQDEQNMANGLAVAAQSGSTAVSLPSSSTYAAADASADHLSSEAAGSVLVPPSTDNAGIGDETHSMSVGTQNIDADLPSDASPKLEDTSPDSVKTPPQPQILPQSVEGPKIQNHKPQQTPPQTRRPRRALTQMPTQHSPSAPTAPTAPTRETSGSPWEKVKTLSEPTNLDDYPQLQSADFPSLQQNWARKPPQKQRVNGKQRRNTNK